jgi:ribosomal protein L1
MKEYPKAQKPAPKFLDLDEAIEKMDAQVNFSGDSYYEALLGINLDYLVELMYHEDFNGFVEGTFFLPHGSGQQPRIIVMTSYPHLQAACKELGALHVGDEKTLGPKFLSNEIQPMWFERIIASSEYKPMLKANTKLSKLLWKWGKRPKPSDTTLLPPDGEFVEIVKAHIQGQIVPFAIDYENDGYCTVLLGKYGKHNVQQVRENLYSVIEHLYSIADEAKAEPIRDDDEDMLILDMGIGVTQLPKNEKDTEYKSTDFFPINVEKIVTDFLMANVDEKDLQEQDENDEDLENMLQKLKLYDWRNDEVLQSEVSDAVFAKPDISGVELRDLRLRSYDAKPSEKKIEEYRKKIAWRTP